MAGGQAPWQLCGSAGNGQSSGARKSWSRAECKLRGGNGVESAIGATPLIHFSSIQGNHASDYSFERWKGGDLEMLLQFNQSHTIHTCSSLKTTACILSETAPGCPCPTLKAWTRRTTVASWEAGTWERHDVYDGVLPLPVTIVRKMTCEDAHNLEGGRFFEIQQFLNDTSKSLRNQK